MERNGKHWITVNRRRIAVWFSDGWIEFGGFDAPPPQHVPQDCHSYAYTHGGEVFQAACDLYWSFPATGPNPASRGAKERRRGMDTITIRGCGDDHPLLM